MFELAWKEIHPNGNQPIRMKSFRTEERRQDFIDSFPEGENRYEITSMNTADNHTLEDFHNGMRVEIERALHPEYIGRTGTVQKTVKRNKTVWIQLDDGKYYGAFPWNLKLA